MLKKEIYYDGNYKYKNILKVKTHYLNNNQ